ncbi:MAG TPA: hypothetical protein VGK85_05945 [Myxococcaceae bacterium]
MQTLPVDIVETVKITLAMLIAIIPLLGLVVRFAAKPVVGAMVAARGGNGRAPDLEGLETRIAALESEVKELTASRANNALPGAIPIRP